VGVAVCIPAPVFPSLPNILATIAALVGVAVASVEVEQVDDALM